MLALSWNGLPGRGEEDAALRFLQGDRKSTRLNSSHSQISYAVFCLKKKIAADSSAALPRAEAAESADLDLLALLQGFNDAIENSFDDGLRLLTGKLGDPQNLFDHIGLRECGLLGHRGYASSRTSSSSSLRTASIRLPSYRCREHRPS